MNQKNLQVLVNIIGAVQSGHQVYGQREYNHYAPPYHSTSKEHTITIGWYCAYGHQARTLIQGIKKADPVLFKKLDNSGIDAMLSKDWEKIRWNPSSKQKATIISMIDSKVGHQVQDQIFIDKMKKLVADCERDYPKANTKAQMMYCQIKHLGGKSAVDRIFKRCNGKYDLDTIMAALVKDQNDTSSSNQVGDRLFWSRHVKCRQFIDQYAEEEREDQPVDLKGKIKSFQKFLNTNYSQILKQAGVGTLSLTGEYGPKTRLAALSVWKFMANKYYGSKLTIGNQNFFDACKVVATRMTDAQIAKHATLESIKTGVLAGRGYSTVKAYQSAKKLSGSGSMNADTWYNLFN